jgi:hypothetical protein
LATLSASDLNTESPSKKPNGVGLVVDEPV